MLSTCTYFILPLTVGCRGEDATVLTWPYFLCPPRCHTLLSHIFPFYPTSLFWKIKVRLCDHQAFCVSHHQLFNGWTILYETWYVYHDTRANLNDVLHKSLPSVCMSLCASPYHCYATARWKISRSKNTHATMEELFGASFSIRFVSYEKKAGD
jgi:hypothetical protein